MHLSSPAQFNKLLKVRVLDFTGIFEGCGGKTFGKKNPCDIGLKIRRRWSKCHAKNQNVMQVGQTAVRDGKYSKITTCTRIFLLGGYGLGVETVPV